MYTNFEKNMIEDILECKGEPAQTLDKIIESEGVKTHIVSSKVLPRTKKYKQFDKIKIFFGEYCNLFLKEENIEIIEDHYFQHLQEHKERDGIDDKIHHHYEDTYLLLLFDDKKNAIFFQKYNGNMIVMREIKKEYNHSEGGVFRVTDFTKCKDFHGNPYLEETSKTMEFESETKIGNARNKALEYMNKIVEYHDIKEQNKTIENINKDPTDKNRIIIKGDTALLLNYKGLPSEDKEKFRKRVYEGRQKIKETYGNDFKKLKSLNSFVDVNESHLKASEKLYLVKQTA